MNPFVVIISNYLLLVYFVNDFQMEEVIAPQMLASMAIAIITEGVGAMMDGEIAFARICNVVMSPHVANMANVATMSVNVTTAGPVMIATTKLSTM